MHKQVRKLFFLLSILLLILSVACVSSTGKKAKAPYNQRNLQKIVYIDDSFLDWEEDEIINALKNWECSTNYTIRFKIILHAVSADYILAEDPTHSIFVRKVKGIDPDIVKADKRIEDDAREKEHNGEDYVKRYTLGLFIPSAEIPTILLVSDRLKYEYYRAVMEHEAGHSLGIDHIDNKDAVMYAHMDSSYKQITNNDLEALCKLYWCDPDKFNACNPR